MNTQTVVYSQVEWDDWHFQTNNLVSMQAGTNLIRFTKEDGFAELDFIGINPGPEGDIDADGLPDPWERRYFCHLYNPCGIPDTDCDGDGQTTLQEYIADTDPTNHCSFLGLTSIQFSYDNPVIYWQGGISATQYLERCVSLTSGVSWSVLFTNIPPTSTTTNWIDSSPDQPAAFYRIRVMRWLWAMDEEMRTRCVEQSLHSPGTVRGGVNVPGFIVYESRHSILALGSPLYCYE